MAEEICLKGVRTHNLKNIDVEIPCHALTVITGVSGSGKSSLAFDTLYAEGQRRYVESLSTYARQFLERIERPDLDEASGMLPAIAIEAKNVVTNARSTVGTQTELYDYLRLLFSRIGVTHCSSCGRKVQIDTPVSAFSDLEKVPTSGDCWIAFPIRQASEKRASLESLLEELQAQGFLSAMVNGALVDLKQAHFGHLSREIAVLVDEVVVNEQNRLRFIDSFENALRWGKGLASVFVESGGERKEHKFSNRFHCAACGLEFRPPSANTFSFNSPLGACPECQGFGRVITIDWNLVIPNPNLSIKEGVVEPFTKPSAKWESKQLREFCARQNIPIDVPFRLLSNEQKDWILKGTDKDRDYFSPKDFFEYLEKKTYKMHVRIFLSKYRGYIPCTTCGGSRLKKEVMSVTVGGENISALTELTISDLNRFFCDLSLTEHELAIAEPILLEIKKRLSFLVEVGLGYLTLDRLSRTLSGGEAQRIHLATSLGSALVDTLYVLDEPSVGLHERDHGLLIGLLKELKKLGNTVVVVEHDRTMMESADHVIDLGPLGGEHGGRVIYAGPFNDLSNSQESFTAKYLRGEFKIERSFKTTDRRSSPSIQVCGASEHNLKAIDVEIPLGQLVVVTGVSGSGKSTLIYDVLYNNYLRYRGRSIQDVGKVREITGWEVVQDVVLVDQSPIGRTPRSNPVTYLKAFEGIRKRFASTREARAKRMTAGHFSFNVPGGRCERCEGDGVVKVEMHFLADVAITCETCQGSRYQDRVLAVRYRGKNIHDVLEMTISEAIGFFGDCKEIAEKLSVLERVGLGYLRLGQSATTLSGGEAQRLKLAAEISQRTGENLLYLFDEPTTGLHYRDVCALLLSFETLLERGHSICVIEHNMEVIKCADYIIDLGPEGGEAGGRVVYSGVLEGILEVQASHTGQALKKYLRKKF